MKKPKTDNELRKHAESILAQQKHPTTAVTRLEIAELVQELNTHQIELQLQNEELRESNRKLSDLYQEFSRLFQYSPVGYAVLNVEGIIIDVNQTLATYLDKESQSLRWQPFNQLIYEEDKGLFNARFPAIYKHPQHKAGVPAQNHVTH